MFNFNFFDADERPTFHVGRRMVKTSLAVFICAIVGYLRGTESAIFSMIAAITCIQPTREQSLMLALNRVLGTVIGGTAGAICLFLARTTGVIDIPPLYYLIISAMLIPLIQLTLLIRKPSTSLFTCIVFLLVMVTRTGDVSSVAYAAERTLETLIGIAVGLGVNWVIPKSKKERAAEAAAKEAEKPAENEDNRDI